MSRLALLALLVGCGGGLESGSYGIVGGAPTTEFPAVVSLFWGDGFLCSGVLIEEQRVLTAGHCLYGFPDDAAALTVRFGPQAETPDESIVAASFAVHPEYATLVTRDLAEVVLSSDAPVAPAGWSRDELSGDDLGLPLTLVGYGEAVPGEDPDLFRRRAETELGEVTDWQLKWFDDDAGICSGDSGGAVFAGGELVGIAVEGDPACAEWGAAVRLSEAADWLDGAAGDDDDDLTVPPPDSTPPPDGAGCADCGSGGYALLPLLILVRRRD